MSGRLGVIAAAIMAGISALHVYWAAGGSTGQGGIIPEVNGKPAFQPGQLATLSVALAMAAASATVAVAAGQSGKERRSPLARQGATTLAFVFAARAIGNFKTAGFSKRVKGTRFATLDTFVYAPLCAFLSACCAAVAR